MHHQLAATETRIKDSLKLRESGVSKAEVKYMDHVNGLLRLKSSIRNCVIRMFT